MGLLLSPLCFLLDRGELCVCVCVRVRDLFVPSAAVAKEGSTRHAQSTAILFRNWEKKRPSTKVPRVVTPLSKWKKEDEL